MAWTTPKTWTSEPLTSADLNTHLRDNLEFLKDPPTAHYECVETADYTTTSTTFVDIDETNLSFTLETEGGDVLIGFHGMVQVNSSSKRTIAFDVAIDGERLGGIAGIHIVYGLNTEKLPVSFVRLVTSLSAGSHTFSLQWRVSASQATLYAGAGSGDTDIVPQFWVREVS